ncbi:MAG TPA: peptide deformylase [Oscillospiraceae bacterium]|nr:peptide deformylase [Oscillospiraceae bacterium]
MAIRNIRVDEDPILRKKSRPVTEFNERLFTLLDDMADTLESLSAIGLAAVQVGVLRRVFICNFGDGIIELINPEIIHTEGTQQEEEACLSLPGKSGLTNRPATVQIKAQNREGKWCIYKGDELKARCFCHEYDHLDGVLYSDKLAEGETLHHFEPENGEE